MPALTGPYAAELAAAVEIATEAGGVVRDLYDRAAAATYIKGDGSPVTDADLASDRLIRARLAERFPGDEVLTEEGVDDDARLASPRVWVVDPIDGTQQFVERTGEFDVLVALVAGGRPVVGAMHQPATGLTLAAALGAGAWTVRGEAWEQLRFAPAAGSPRLVTSSWLGAPQTLPELTRIAGRLGSPEPVVNRLGVSLRLFLPPSNRFDVLLGLDARPDRTMAWEWDFAAADIVAHEAGGRMTDTAGQPHRYNKPHPRNTGGIVLSVDPVTHAAVIAAIAAGSAIGGTDRR